MPRPLLNLRSGGIQLPCAKKAASPASSPAGIGAGSFPPGCPRDAAHARSDEDLERPRRAHRSRRGIPPVGRRLHRCARRRLVPSKADRRRAQSARHPLAPFQQGNDRATMGRPYRHQPGRRHSSRTDRSQAGSAAAYLWRSIVPQWVQEVSFDGKVRTGIWEDTPGLTECLNPTPTRMLHNGRRRLDLRGRRRNQDLPRRRLLWADLPGPGERWRH